VGFFSDLFGGPSAQEKQIANQQQTLAATLNANYGQRFGEQSQIFQNLNKALTPIVNLGASQMGWSPQLASAVNTQNINAAGAAARNAQQYTGSVLAGRGGGGANPQGITSGIEAAIRGTEASAAENQLSASQLQATEENARAGQQNFWNATSGEHALATAENPEAYGQMADTAGQNALKDATQLSTERRNAAFAPISLAMKGVGAALGGFGNLDMAGSSSFGEQLGNFGSGALNSLAGQ
jgi:hypothetical protein